LHDNNELSVLQYNEDSNNIQAAEIYPHPDQVWAIESSPNDTSLVVTSRQSVSGSKSATLWKMKNQDDNNLDNLDNYNNDQFDLSEIASFSHSQKSSVINSIKWHKSNNKLLTMDSKTLSLWNIYEDKINVTINNL
jgi:WD40 repeat protein